MFPWNIAKSAEAVFSRWAMRRVCKFLLKKKLGKFILGEVDLDQLDVQLGKGTIQLSDLALNVDYLNQKFGAAAALLVKEGSIGSLLMTMPWTSNGCQIEVDELEVVLAPRTRNALQGGCEAYSSSQDRNDCVNHDLGMLDNENANNNVQTSLVNVHEGVKTVAKMVKWLLSSFHVKVRKLIVAFDPCSEEGDGEGFCKSLVLRVTEAECGTLISEEANSKSDVIVDSFLGASKITSFLKFDGAVLELLDMDGANEEAPFPSASCNSIGEWSRCFTSNATIPLLTGERGGFSGNLKISIPWKNGSFDIHKVDTDAYIDPVVLRFQPSSIRCFIYLWSLFKENCQESKSPTVHNGAESVRNNATLNRSFLSQSSCTFTDKVVPDHADLSTGYNSLENELVANALLSESHLISDWVTRSKKERTEEPDFGESVDQFFECFDGLRNSQSALGNTGMWNWTSSVFSAITAVSSLASGSIHIPSDQQHVETNLRVTFTKISLLYSFINEDLRQSSNTRVDQTNPGSSVHFVSANLEGTCLMLQIRSREMDLEVIVHHMEVADHSSARYGSSENFTSQVTYLQTMRESLMHTLPPLCSSKKYTEPANLPRSADVSLSIDSFNRCTCSDNCARSRMENVMKVVLFRTSGDSRCLVKLNPGSSGDSFRPKSVSVWLPLVVFWLDSNLMSVITELVGEYGNSSELVNRKVASGAAATSSQLAPSTSLDAGNSFRSRGTNISPEESFCCNIFLPRARTIFCFPLEKSGCGSYDQFIAIDISSQSTSEERNIQSGESTSSSNSKEKHAFVTSCSMHLNLGNLDFYFVSSDSAKMSESKSFSMQNDLFSIQKVISIANGPSHRSVISMFWQEGPVTGPWIAKRAKLLVCSEKARTRDRCMGQDHEFASATTVKDVEDIDSNIRQEMILSSGFFLHAHLSPVLVNLSKSEYENLHSVLRQLINFLSGMTSLPREGNEVSTAFQTSVLVECEDVTISISPEAVESIRGSIQNEVPGYWHSLRLELRNFEILSVANLGGISSSSFLYVAHGEGNLWGSATGVAEKEFLLISCSNSTMGRGDGEGSNVLSSRLSGSEIIHLQDSEQSHSSTSITIRCGTIVAAGGRLDWLDRIVSFFSFSSPEIEQVGSNSLQSDSGSSGPCGSSFVLNLVDIGLSYEPYLNNLVLHQGLGFKCSSTSSNDTVDQPFIACLLAASSLRLSNTMLANSVVRDYRIIVHDLGLLLRKVLQPTVVCSAYSVEHLRDIGYVKVAQEAHIEALLRINCGIEDLWELECSDSHIILSTCNDTTSGLIRLASQLQQLFAPDVEETIVHLQTRWNNVQQVHENGENWNSDDDCIPLTSQVKTPKGDTRNRDGLGNLMDEICENAFQLNVNSDVFEPDFHQSHEDGFLCEASNSRIGDPESSLANFPCTGSVLPISLEKSEPSFSQKNTLDFIEEYFLSHPCTPCDLSKDLSATNICKSNSKINAVKRENNGWYGDSSLNILENHVSEFNEQACPQKLVESAVSSNHAVGEERGKIKGRVIVKGMNVIWRMYAGSDWDNAKKIVQRSDFCGGRDATACLELVLSGIDLLYDILPDGVTCVSRLTVTLQDIYLNDSSTDAPWKLVLGYYQSQVHPRRFSSKAFKLHLEAIRPDPLTPLEEYRLRAALLPMRLHLHQSQLDFLISFFGESSSSGTVDNLDEQIAVTKDTIALSGHTIVEEALLPYFQKFEIQPVLVRVDYSPCRVDLAALREGKYVELVNLVPWKGVELHLKHVEAVGVYGWGSVCETIIGEWLEDISQNQIHKLLRGLPPIRSLVAVGSGARKLVSLPVKSYKKDQKLLRGMQRGTIAFLRSISLEAIGLGVHLAAGAHEILLQAEYILTSIPPPVAFPSPNRVNTSVRSNQPKDARQGIQQAYESISDGLSRSASTLVQTPLKRYQRGATVGSALVTAVQSAPAAALAPASATVRAVHCTLLGFRNSLDPEHKKESLNKYSGSDRQQFP